MLATLAAITTVWPGPVRYGPLRKERNEGKRSGTKTLLPAGKITVRRMLKKIQVSSYLQVNTEQPITSISGFHIFGRTDPALLPEPQTWPRSVMAGCALANAAIEMSHVSVDSRSTVSRPSVAASIDTLSHLSLPSSIPGPTRQPAPPKSARCAKAGFLLRCSAQTLRLQHREPRRRLREAQR
jgi:hypothetical protein